MPEKRNTLFFFLVLFALLLRLYGITFEIPHPDDYITVQGAMHFGPANVTPTGYGLYGLYVMPAFTLVIIQTILFTLYYFLGWIFGSFENIETFRNLYLMNPSSFYLIGRLMCVAFGVGSVAIVYNIAIKLYSYRIALFAGLFLAASFIHVMHCQFIRPDIPTTFFILVTIHFCIKLIEQPSRKNYIYSGIFSGLATATKFTSGLIIVPVLVAHLISEGKYIFERTDEKPKKNLVVSSFITLGIVALSISIIVTMLHLITVDMIRVAKYEPTNRGFVSFLTLLNRSMGAFGVLLIIFGIISNYSKEARNFILNIILNKKLYLAASAAFLSFLFSDPIFILDFMEQIRVLVTDPNFFGENLLFIGVDSIGFWGNLWWYVTGSLSWGAGVHIAIMGGIGLIVLLYRRNKLDLIVFLFPLIYFISICNGNFKWERYTITLMPFVAISAAIFIDLLIKKTVGERRSIMRAVFIAGLTLFITAPQAYNILRYEYLLTQKDTRKEAKEWVERSIPTGSKIAQDAYTGNISDMKFKITRKFSISDSPLEFYAKNGYQYLMVSDTQFNRYLAEPERYPDNVKFYEKLFSEGTLIKEFIPRKDLWPKPEDRFRKYHIHVSPTIRIFKIL